MRTLLLLTCLFHAESLISKPEHHNSDAAFGYPPTDGQFALQKKAVGEPLRVRCNSGGFGNRLGWWLSAATVGEVLGRPVYTYWNLASEGRAQSKHGGYNWQLMQQLMTFPESLHFVDNNDTLCLFKQNTGEQSCCKQFDQLSYEEIPFHPRLKMWYVNDYTMEPSFKMWEGYAKHGTRCSQSGYPCAIDKSFGAIWAPGNISKETYMNAYRDVALQVQPRKDLCTPSRRSYLVVHLRRGDVGDPGLDSVMESFIKLKSLDLPVMVVSNRKDAAIDLEQKLLKAGHRITNRSCLPSDLVEHPRDFNTAGLLQDFFGMSRAAGIIVSARHNGESSVSTVASEVGQTPLLIPRGDQNPQLLQWMHQGNDGRPLSNLYFGAEEDFFEAVKSISSHGVPYG